MPSKRAKHFIFLSVGLVCVAIAAYLQAMNLSQFYASLIVAFTTILAPLFSALYVYTGKTARYFLILTGIGILFALIYTVDLLTTFENFKTICNGRGPGHTLLIMSNSYTCTAPSEVDYLVTYPYTVAGNALLFWPFVLVILTNVGNLLYLAVRPLFRRK